MKQLIITPKLCIDCHICELACSMSHTKTWSQEQSRVRTIKDVVDGITVPEICLECIDAACMQSCPSKAIYLDETLGAVLINYSRCIGCKSCIAGCPFGNMFANTKTGRGVFKCDLCFGDPACARYCPTGAIRYRECEPLAGKQEMVRVDVEKEPAGVK